MQAPSPDVDAVRRAVDRGNAQWIESFRSGSADRLAELFDESGTMLRDNGAYSTGRGEIRDAMAETMERLGPTETTIDTETLWVLGDLAYETGRYTYSFTSGDGTRTEAAGRYVVCWKRQTDDTWKINLDLGLPDD